MAFLKLLSLPARGSLWNYVRPGARLLPLEWVGLYALPCAFAAASPALLQFALANAATQAVLFLLVVILPVALTGKMAYVDIGWPTGLVLIALRGFAMGDGLPLRRMLTCTAMALHGGRMAAGALVLFWPYKFEEDLPRYKFAAFRWQREDGMASSGWRWKMLGDVAGQGVANMALLATPVALASHDTWPTIAPLEVVGWAVWAFAWIAETVADVQKQLFLLQVKVDKQSGKLAKSLQGKPVLGFAPYDGPRYWMWTWCRHPNYFCEWLAWCGLALSAAPCVMDSVRAAKLLGGGASPAVARLGFGLALFLLPRMLYDCLVWWTGSAPAEHFSFRKRPAYSKYQTSTRCFWPIELPLVDHFRRAGWPHLRDE